MSCNLSCFRKSHRIHKAVERRYHSRPENKHRSYSVVKSLKTGLCVDVEEEIARGGYKRFRLLELTVPFKPLVAHPQSSNHHGKDRFIPGNQQLSFHQTKDDGHILVRRENIGRHSFNRGGTATVWKLFLHDPIHELLKLCFVRNLQQDSSGKRFRVGNLVNNNFGARYEAIEILRFDASRSGLANIISKCSGNWPIS